MGAAIGAPMGARARARQERGAACEAAEIQEGAREAAEIQEEQGWYRCPYSYCRMEGNFTPSTVAKHEAVHREEEEKARAAQEQRAAARQRAAAARGKAPGKAARKQAARDKRFGK